MTPRAEFRHYMKAANGTSGNDSHLTEAQILAFCRGAVSESEREASEAHLVDCEQCIALFRSARDFVESAGGDEAIDQAEINLAWQSTWSRAQSDTAFAGDALVEGSDLKRPHRQIAGLNWLKPWWRPALAFLLLAMIAGVLIYVSTRPGSNTPQKAQQAPTTSTPDRPPETAQHEAPPTRDNPSPPSPSTASDTVLAFNIKAPRGSGFDDSATRGEREDAARTSLLTARKILLDVSGNQTTGNLLRDRLDERLPAGGRFLLTADRTEAEVALKIEAESPHSDPAQVSFTARVVGADGRTLWPTLPGVIARRYQGQAKKAADQMLNDLLDEIHRLERKRP